MRVIEDHKEFERIDRELSYVKSHIVIIGFISEKIVTKGKKKIDVRTYAVINEFGTIYIPARPFFRTATQSRKAKRTIEEYIDKQINLILIKGKSGKAAMQAIGIFVVGQIKLSILKGKWKANTPETLARKTPTKPLLDTNTMLDSVEFEIRRK